MARRKKTKGGGDVGSPLPPCEICSLPSGAHGPTLPYLHEDGRSHRWHHAEPCHQQFMEQLKEEADGAR